jgi:predicted nucleic-acid-binding protein
MTAVDTNVLIRVITRDDPKQTIAARALFETEEIWISKTVLLETWWVLESFYRFETSSIRDAIGRLLGLRNVHAEDESGVAAALGLAAQGIEFADAIHLSSRPAGADFVSCDKTFVRRARRAVVSGISDVSVQDSTRKP